METPIIGGVAQAGAEGLIKDTTTNDFVTDVLDASRDALVLVDFWAPWCGPCKQLTPVLEKTVKALGGAVRLVKLNIDEHPAIPGQMGVQSIPAVFAFKDGRPVDGFMGALPESQIRAFIDRLLGPEGRAAASAPIDAALAALEAGDVSAAASAFAALLQKDAANVDAAAGLARCYLASGDLERAEETLAMVPANKADAAPVSAARAMLELARKTGDGADAASLRARLEQNPRDYQTRYDLAIALNAAGDRAGAVEQLIAIASEDREWNDDGARKQLVQLFEAWGPSDPATIDGRRRLSLLLFS